MFLPSNSLMLLEMESLVGTLIINFKENYQFHNELSVQKLQNIWINYFPANLHSKSLLSGIWDGDHNGILNI